MCILPFVNVISFMHCVFFVKCIKTLINPSDICRIVNGLLKTALGPPSGSTTTLSPVQDITFRHESVKCMVNIIKSMGAWMDRQRLGDSYLPKTNESDTPSEKTKNQLTLNGEEGTASDYDVHLEGNSDAATLEQRRAFKLELQVELCFTCLGHILSLLYSHQLIVIWDKYSFLPSLLCLVFYFSNSFLKRGSPFDDDNFVFYAERYLTVQ